MKRWLPAAGLTGIAVLLGVVAFPDAASAHPVKPAKKAAAAARPAAKATGSAKAAAAKKAAAKAKAKPSAARAGKTTICHRTRSAKNPYVRITVSNNALPAHRRHTGPNDIIPAPASGCPGARGGTTTPPPPRVQPTVRTQGNTPAVRVTQARKAAVARTQARAQAQAQARSNARQATLPETGFDPMTGAMAALALLIIGTGLTRVGNRRQAAYTNMGVTSTTSDSGLMASARRFHVRGAKAPPPVPRFRRSR